MLTNIIHNSSSENMSEVDDNSVHLVVTSPPYNVGKEYDKDLTLDEYLSFLNTVWKECYRVLVPGGRICVNLASSGKKPYVQKTHFVSIEMTKIGFYMRGEIIWNKGVSGSGSSSTAWGSWMSPSCPHIRDIHEDILIFSKGYGKLESINKEKDITREEFMEYTKSIWNMRTENKHSNPHPAPFPEELPRRLIKLYTYIGDTVLDPFMGSGTSAITAMKLGRQYVGYETESRYVDMIKERMTKI